MYYVSPCHVEWQCKIVVDVNQKMIVQEGEGDSEMHLSLNGFPPVVLLCFASPWNASSISHMLHNIFIIVFLYQTCVVITHFNWVDNSTQTKHCSGQQLM